LLSDCLKGTGESFKADELVANAVEQMSKMKKLGMICPVLVYLYKSKNWQTFGTIEQSCQTLLEDLPEFYLLKARVALVNEQNDKAKKILADAEKLIENPPEAAKNFEDVHLFKLERIRYLVKAVSPEAAIAALTSYQAEERLKIKGYILSEKDFNPLWLMNSLYTLMRCAPTEFKAEYLNGTEVSGYLFYEDDKKLHVKLPDGAFAIIYKKDLKQK